MFRSHSAAPDRRQHVAHEVERPLDEALVRGQVTPHADNADAIHRFLGKPGIAIAVENDAGRAIRCAGDDGDLMAPLDPAAGMFVGPRRRGVDFRRKVMGEEEDVHWRSPKRLFLPSPPLRGRGAGGEGASVFQGSKPLSLTLSPSRGEGTGKTNPCTNRKNYSEYQLVCRRNGGVISPDQARRCVITSRPNSGCQGCC